MEEERLPEEKSVPKEKSLDTPGLKKLKYCFIEHQNGSNGDYAYIATIAS
jgi:hypothetical protein